MTRILGVAPYPGLQAVMESLAQMQPDIRLNVRTGDYQDGLNCVEQEDLSQYDVILSRGGTADLIRAHVSLPVVDIELSHYDILNAVKLAESHRCAFAVVGFPSTAKSVALLRDLLQYDFPIHTTRSMADVQDTIVQLKKEQIPLVLGDTVVAQCARENGLDAILMTSGSRSVAAAFDRARELADYGRALRRDLDFYHAALADARRSLIFLGQGGQLLFSDAPASRRSAYIQQARRLYPRLYQKNAAVFLRRVGNQTVQIQGRMLPGEPVLLLEFSELPEQGLTLRDEAPDEELLRLFYRGEPWDIQFALGRSAKAVVLLGERGTGKAALATHLHRLGPYAGTPMVEISCSQLSQKAWELLLDETRSPLLAKGTVFHFSHLEGLSRERLEGLLPMLKAQHSGNQFLFSTDSQDNLAALRRHFSPLTVELPPLRSRIHEIPLLCARYLSYLESQGGRQLAGIEPEGLSYLQGFSWPENLRQLCRVLDVLAEATRTPYILTPDVRSVLSGEKVRPAALGTGIRIDQPLDGIIRDAVGAVLAQEGMNRTRAAQQLGICRATLWKYSKEP